MNEMLPYIPIYVDKMPTYTLADHVRTLGDIAQSQASPYFGRAMTAAASAGIPRSWFAATVDWLTGWRANYTDPGRTGIAGMRNTAIPDGVSKDDLLNSPGMALDVGAAFFARLLSLLPATVVPPTRYKLAAAAYAYTAGGSNLGKIAAAVAGQKSPDWKKAFKSAGISDDVAGQMATFVQNLTNHQPQFSSLDVAGGSGGDVVDGGNGGQVVPSGKTKLDLKKTAMYSALAIAVLWGGSKLLK